MCDEISKLSKTKNSIKGKVTSFRNCDDIWIFYCKDIHLKIYIDYEKLLILKRIFYMLSDKIYILIIIKLKKIHLLLKCSWLCN